MRRRACLHPERARARRLLRVAVYITTLHGRIIFGLNHSLLEIEAVLLSRMSSVGMYDVV
jgi:hypothetical protein